MCNRRCSYSDESVSQRRWVRLCGILSLLVLVSAVFVSGAESTFAQDFIRGDVNADGVVDNTDICGLQCLVFGTSTCNATGEACTPELMSCELAADVDDNGTVSISDITYLVYFLMGATPPPAPFPDCGPDPTDPQPGASCCGASCCVGSTGNVNGSADDVTDIGDLTALIGYLFVPPYEAPACMEEANVDGIGVVDIGDLTTLIGYLFIPPYEPTAACP